MAHIAGHENSRHTGFKYEWIAVRCPITRPLPFLQEMPTGIDIPLRVPFDDATQPIGVWNSPDVKQERTGGNRLPRARFIVYERNAFTASRALHFQDARIQPHDDILR